MGKTYARVSGWDIRCSAAGVLYVRSPDGVVVSVLPRGTHAALDVFGEQRKQEIVAWWRLVRGW